MHFMSAKPQYAKAEVYDLRPSHLARVVERQSRENPPSIGAVLDDLADGLEAIHQCANLAGFSARPRALILALATCARSSGSDYVELLDDNLAKLQNCSRKTVQRQRRDYMREAQTLKFDLIGIIEGTYDREAKLHEPSRYRFIASEVVERIVAQSRATEGWDGLDRKRQREIIARVAARIFEDIPDAPPRRRKRKSQREATAEIITCQKVVSTQLAKLRQRVSYLGEVARERLLNEPGGLRDWWRVECAEMELFCDVDSPQHILVSPVEDSTGQLVQHPSREDPDRTELRPEDRAAWEKLESRLQEPAIHRVGIELHCAGSTPSEQPAVMNDRRLDTITDEELEAEAVRAEACNERVPWDE